MASPSFRLETLLKRRRLARNQRQTEVARAQQTKGVLEEQMMQLKTEFEETHQHVRQNAGPGEVDIEAVLAANQQQMILKAEQSLVDERRQQLQIEIECRTEALSVADRDVKTLEKLQEKQYEKYRREQIKRNQRQIDEIAQLSHLTMELRESC